MTPRLARLLAAVLGNNLLLLVEEALQTLEALPVAVRLVVLVETPDDLQRCAGGKKILPIDVSAHADDLGTATPQSCAQGKRRAVPACTPGRQQARAAAAEPKARVHTRGMAVPNVPS